MSLSSPFPASTAARRQKRAVSSPAEGVVTGAPRIILRLEGAAVLAVASAAYAHIGMGWMLFAVLFLVPDISMLGYLAGPRVGAATYNLGHTYILPVILGALGFLLSHQLLAALCLIWLAHVGFDRMLGYGLKYATAFGHTHLGVVGRPEA
jgi:hypothetical protein